MTTVIGGSSPSITFSDSTTQSTAFTGLNQSASPYTTSLGYQALNSNTATNNTAVGYQAGYNNNATGNTYLGYQAGYSNTGSGYVTCIGNLAGYSTTSSNFTAVGQAAGQYTTGNGVFIGSFAGQGVNGSTSGTNNTAVGISALTSFTTGTYNTALGYSAGSNITTGQYNTCIGGNAGAIVTTGSYNTFISSRSNGGASYLTGSNNTCVGDYAGNLIAGGANQNTLIGQGAGSNTTTGSNILCVGYNTQPSGATDTNELVIGTGTSTGKGSNTGFLNNNFGGTYQGNNSASWSTTSDQRLKKNIVTNTDGLNKVSQLVVRNFEYRLPEEVDPTLKPTDAIPITGTQIGFIAQELQDILPDCVKTESTGVMGINIENVTYHLVNAIKDLNALVTAQATEIAALKAKVGI